MRGLLFQPYLSVCQLRRWGPRKNNNGGICEKEVMMASPRGASPVGELKKRNWTPYEGEEMYKAVRSCKDSHLRNPAGKDYNTERLNYTLPKQACVHKEGRNCRVIQALVRGSSFLCHKFIK